MRERPQGLGPGGRRVGQQRAHAGRDEQRLAEPRGGDRPRPTARPPGRRAGRVAEAVAGVQRPGRPGRAAGPPRAGQQRRCRGPARRTRRPRGGPRIRRRPSPRRPPFVGPPLRVGGGHRVVDQPGRLGPADGQRGSGPGGGGASAARPGQRHPRPPGGPARAGTGPAPGDDSSIPRRSAGSRTDGSSTRVRSSQGSAPAGDDGQPLQRRPAGRRQRREPGQHGVAHRRRDGAAGGGEDLGQVEGVAGRRRRPPGRGRARLGQASTGDGRVGQPLQLEPDAPTARRARRRPAGERVVAPSSSSR